MKGQPAGDQPRVCVVGSCMIDLIARVPRLPTLGETLVGRSFHLGYGGKGANQAVAAAKLGARVSMVGRVGADVFGDGTLENFRALGVDARHVQQDANRSTGVAPILVDDRADNAIVIVPGANTGLTVQDVRVAAPLIEGADVVCGQLEAPVEATLAAFRLARDAGVTTILNPAPAAAIPGELLRLVDVCVPNEVEARTLTDRPVDSLKDAQGAAADLVARGARAVIVTLGDRGAVLVQGRALHHVPAHEVKAVDPTGAGDAFIGALAVGLAEGRSILDAVRWANAAAALSVMQIGTQISFASRPDLDTFLATAGATHGKRA